MATGAYNIAKEDSVYEFGIVQGRALFADPETQGDPDWPVCDAHDDFAVGTPPDILANHELTNAYLSGVERGLAEAEEEWLSLIDQSL